MTKANADIKKLSGKFRVHKDGLTDSSSLRGVRRARDSLVCNQCRQSKLKCDRMQPCGSCEKRNEGDRCSYQRCSDRMSEQQRAAVVTERLVHLETVVRELMSAQPLQQSGSLATPPERLTPPSMPSGLSEMIERAQIDGEKGNPYVGATHWSAILDDIQEIKAAVAYVASDSPPMDNLNESFPMEGAEHIFGFVGDCSLMDIITNYLPSKVEIDRALSVYFRGETYIVPFIHTFQFQKQYQAFLGDMSNTDPLWLSILFSICYLASLIAGPTNSYRSSMNGPATGNLALHEAAGKCLILGQYHRPQKLGVEALALYGLCKNLRTLDPSREVGTILSLVVRAAHELGYHRDPDSFGSFTPFEGEMRRRCWSSIKQFDLMTSFMLGLPSNVCLENCDARSPSNLLDADFDVDTNALPPSRPATEYTRLLWFIVKDKQMTGFAKVCRETLSFREKSDLEIFELDQEIRRRHERIPEILRTRPICESITDSPFHILTRLYIEFIHLKSLCVLHRKYMAEGRPFSSKACVDAAKSMIRQFHDMYKEFQIGGQLEGERWMLSNFTMNDFLLGNMVLCLFLHLQRTGKIPSDHQTQNLAIDILEQLEQSLNVCIEKSESSKDAARVAQVIRMTITRTTIALTAQNMHLLTPPHVSNSAISADLTQNHELPGQSEDVRSLESLMDPYLLSDENFGPLDSIDPFKSYANEDGMMDWTGFGQF